VAQSQRRRNSNKRDETGARVLTADIVRRERTSRYSPRDLSVWFVSSKPVQRSSSVRWCSCCRVPASRLLSSGQEPTTQGYSPDRPMAFRYARGATHGTDCLLAQAGDSVVGVVYRLYCFSTWESAFYFSTTSYTTVHYGDLLLPRAWRLEGPKERITGVLICADSP
jgi:hypothetical protein